MKFLVNLNCVIVCISDDIFVNEQGLFQCDNMIYCETTLSLYEDTNVPSWVAVGDQYINGKFIHVEAPKLEPEEE